MRSSAGKGLENIFTATHEVWCAIVADPLTNVQCLLVAVCFLATLYVFFASIATLWFDSVRQFRGSDTSGAPVTDGIAVLKPLCGIEPRLYENLASFCAQSMPGPIQLLFGVSTISDPAIVVVRRLQAAYPQHDIELVIDSRIHGSNLKVSNLINMASHIRHNIVVLADSDIAVPPDYLVRVTAPLKQPDVGIVTCLYRAQSICGFWSRIGALFINEWFGPSVRVAHTFGLRKFGFGATLALRRETLTNLGGFTVLKDCLADDYLLAEQTRKLGLRTILSSVTVDTDVIEPTLSALWAREIRWLRTIRCINPLGFSFLFVTFTSPWLLLGAWLSYRWGIDAKAEVMTAVVGIGTVARILVHARSARHSRTFWCDLPLIPLRDGLMLIQWLCASVGSRVMWRGNEMSATNQMTGMTKVPAVNAVKVITPVTPRSTFTEEP